MTDPARELNELSHQIGNFIQYWGFKHIHGRIWLHLFLSKTPLDSLALRKRLSVSKALISISLKDLLRYQVIQSAGKSAEGTLLYSANHDLRAVVFGVLRSRECKIISDISMAEKNIQKLLAEQQSALDNSSDLCPIQAQKLSEIVSTTEECLNTVLAMERISPALIRPLLSAVSNLR